MRTPGAAGRPGGENHHSGPPLVVRREPPVRGAGLATRRERGLAELARRQHGAVSFAQLRQLGFGRHAIAHRLDQGRLHRVHRGVYAVGHGRLTLHGRLWAAVLTDAGALSHRSAASLWTSSPPRDA